MSYDTKPTDYFKNERREMLDFLPEKVNNVLDVGCGEGVFGHVLKQKVSGEVWGVEYVDSKAERAKQTLDKVYAGDIGFHIAGLPDNYFDVVYCNDVLEHLADPYSVLERFKNKLTDRGVVISSIPNLRYHHSLFSLLFRKEFKYEEHGVMDKTHLRFFTGKSIRRMFENAGYEVLEHKGINRSKSVKPYLYNIPLLFTALDIRYPQYGTVARVRR